MSQNGVRRLLAVAFLVVSANLFAQTVSPSGSLTYEYPIKTPPGAGGMAPEISLYYDSSMENGILGVGWSIKGLSIITRDPSYPINFDDNTDHFVYNGQKLIKGTDGFYHTKYESFLRIQFDVASSNWTVTDKQGRTSYFGNTPDSHVDAIGHSGMARVWALNKVMDTLGNYYAVSYVKDAVNGSYYPNEITYTKNDANPLPAFNSVMFSYETRPDHGPVFIPSSVETTERLKWITVTVSGTLLRKYRLDYENGTSTSRSRTTAIQEYGSDGNFPPEGLLEGSYLPTGSVLPPTTFSWQDSGGTFTPIMESANGFNGYSLNSSMDRVLVLDYNGDGESDLLMYRPGAGFCGLYRSNGDGSFTCVYGSSTGFNGFSLNSSADIVQVLDYNGDGKSDLLIYRAGGGYCGLYRSNGDGTFTCVYGSSTGFYGFNLNSSADMVQVLDCNGDGKSDLLFYVPGSGWCFLFRSNGDGTFTCTYASANGFAEGGIRWDFASRSDRVLVLDYNGDGISDLLFYRPGSGYCYLYRGNADGAFTCTMYSGNGLGGFNMKSGASVVQALDYNGDGKSDLLFYVPGSGYCFLFRSNGDGTFANIIASGNGIGGFNLQHSASVVQILDYDGDGKSDLLFYVPGSGYCFLFRSNGDGTFACTYASATGFSGFNLNLSAATVQTLDCNGDGKSDLLFYVPGSGWCFLFRSDPPAADLLSSITTSSGGTISATYTPAPQVPGAVIPSNSAYPIIANASARPTVTKLLYNDGLGGATSTFSTSYSYSNGLLLSGTPDVRKDLGFASVTATDDFTKAYTTTYYRQDPPCDGLVDRVVTYDNTGKPYLETANFYTTNASPLPGNATAQPGVNYVYKTAQETHNYNGDPTTFDTYREEYIYDAYGNVIKIENRGDIANRYDDVTVDMTYAINTTNWVMAPSLKKVSSFDLNDTWGLSSQEQDYYDGLPVGQIASGLLTTKVSGNGSTTATETYGYDVFGNLIWTRDGRANAGEYTTHTTDIAYDSSYHAYMASQTNALGQATFITSDSLMRPISITDPNGKTWTIQYDVFSRQTATIYPLDSPSEPTTTTTYLDGPPRGIFYRKGSGSATIDSYTYFDGLGRVIQTKNKDVNGWVTVDTFYDAAGRIHQTSVPYESNTSDRTVADTSQKYTQQDYDAIGRVSQIWHPDGTSSQIPLYGKKSITAVDENGHVAVRQFDGRVTTDIRYTGTYNSKTAYSTTTLKNALSGVRITDTKGNILQTTLDILGRKTAYSDPDMGSWSYTYDADGNLLSQTDAKGQTRTLQYDRLNRVTSKQFPDGSTETYTYDELTHGEAPVGNLTTATFNRGSESFFYDARGRIRSQTKVLDGSSRGMSYLYDSLDRVMTKIYPDGENVTQSYDSRGNLASLTGTGSYQYVYGIQYTPYGKMSRMIYGNGAVTNYDYYDDSTKPDQSAGTTYSYRLRGINITRGLSLIANASYEYDKKDNVVLKTFVWDNPISGRGQLTYTEQYGYDDLDRLISANSPNVYGSKTYRYDELDNITLKDGRSYSYGATKPHAVVSDGTYTYTYDTNGNMATRSDGRTITYDAANRVTAISDGGSYSYDDEGQRTIKTENGVSTYYFFPEYEETRQSGQPTIAVKYYFANGIRIAERSTVDGLLFYHSDHLGSAVRITKDDGSIVKTIAYDPYGATVYEDGALTLTHKFTDQIQDAGTGLYYYGARYYDPILGRFISPDTVLDGLNRYTYCHNNPVRFVDPTGNQDGDCANYGYDWPGPDTTSKSSNSGNGHGGSGTGGSGNGGSDGQKPTTSHVYMGDTVDGKKVYQDVVVGQEVGNQKDDTSKGGPSVSVESDPPTVGEVMVEISEVVHHGGETVAKYGWDAQKVAVKTGNIPSWVGGGIIGLAGTLVAVVAPESRDDWALWATVGPLAVGARVEGDLEIDVVKIVTSETRLRLELHHLLPREFVDRFRSVGLEIEDFTIEITQLAHRLKAGNGVHTGPNNWNKQWKAFFDGFLERNENFTVNDVLGQLAKMKSIFAKTLGLGD